MISRTSISFILLSLSGTIACTKSKTPEGETRTGAEASGQAKAQTSAQTSAKTAEEARPLDIRGRPGLLFSYLDTDGNLRSTETLADIPESRRQGVRVIDLALAPEERGAGKWVYVADLRQAKADGSYPYQILSQVRFEQAVTNQAIGEKVQESLAASADRVTIYTTSWCGVCAKAKAFLKKRGVAFIERDVEQDPSAQVELQAKAKRAGVAPQGVPVIDVYGELMLGFDEGHLVQLLAAKHGKAETL
jgi:glutaredoxin